MKVEINEFINELRSLNHSREENISKVKEKYYNDKYSECIVYSELEYIEERDSLIELLKNEDNFVDDIIARTNDHKIINDIILDNLNSFLLLSKIINRKESNYNILLENLYYSINNNYTIEERYENVLKYFQIDRIKIKYENGVYLSEKINIDLLEKLLLLKLNKSDNLDSLINTVPNISLDIELDIHSKEWIVSSEDDNPSESMFKNLGQKLSSICFKGLPKIAHTLAVGAIVLGTLNPSTSLASDDLDEEWTQQDEIELQAHFDYMKNFRTETPKLMNEFEKRLRDYHQDIRDGISESGASQYCTTSMNWTANSPSVKGANYQIKGVFKIGNIKYVVDYDRDSSEVSAEKIKGDPCNVDQESMEKMKKQIKAGFDEYKERFQVIVDGTDLKNKADLRAPANDK